MGRRRSNEPRRATADDRGSCLPCALRVGVVLLLLALIPLAYVHDRFAFHPDRGWIDEQHLTLEPFVKPVVAENGFDYYQSAVALMVGEPPAGPTAGGALEWRKLQDAPPSELAALVDGSRAALDVLHSAADTPYVSPAEPDPAMLFDWLANFRKLVRLAAADVMVQHRCGRDAPALARARDGFALAVNVPREGSLIESLVGDACAAIVARPAFTVLVESRLPASEYRAHARYMRALRERQQPFSRTLHFESRHLTEWLVPEVERDPETVLSALSSPPSGADEIGYRLYLKTWDGNAAREWYADRYARLMAEADKPFGQSRMAELAERSQGDAEARNDVLGGMVLPTTAEPYNGFLARTARLIAQETAAAIAAYRADRGRLPESLGALVPAYLPELPPDPFTGDPLRYKRLPGGYQLYSVGANKVDDRCLPSKQGMEEGDLVFVPVPPG